MYTNQRKFGYGVRPSTESYILCLDGRTLIISVHDITGEIKQS